ncbi:MAG: lipid-A-disaccharide synthase [Paludibacter sp.]|nr:lipid-A-disaccharide synthase [Paludibacter sp.]
MRYFIIAGEASGDLHASNLMRELKNTDHEADFCFLGGDLMLSQEGKLIKHYKDMAFMGFIPVIMNAGKIRQNMKDCKSAILEYKPDVVIMIDYPSFNLRIARFVKKNTQIPVFYYISPKLWAWKEYRIKDIKKYVDKMYTIFPFETEYFAGHNFQVEYVGNPSVDSVLLRENQDETFETFCTTNQLENKPIIAILAGSRQQEIKTCLPKMVKAAGHFPEYQIVIGGAPGIEPSFYQKFMPDNNCRIVFGQTYHLLQQATAAIVNSGTATLETALFKVPEVVVYYVILGPLSLFLKKIFIKVKYISLVNLIAGKEIVKELIAHHFTEKNVAAELNKILNNPEYRSDMTEGYLEVLEKLGEPGTAKRAATKIYAELLSRR